MKLPQCGTEEDLSFYRSMAVDNMGFDEACKSHGLTRAEGTAALARVKIENPHNFCFDRWPTKAQIDAFRCIHPDLGNMTQAEAAEFLGVAQPTICERITSMRVLFPEAFAFENAPKPTKRNTVPYDSKKHDNHIRMKF